MYWKGMRKFLGEHMKQCWADESGVVMVEASIYFPIVIFTVFAMIYFGMVKYQESILTFQVEKLAIMGGRVVAYQGYEVWADEEALFSTSVDFESGRNFSSAMEDYYSRHSEHLYNEWKFD